MQHPPSSSSDGHAYVWANIQESSGKDLLKGSSVVWCQFFIYIQKKAQVQIQKATVCCETSSRYLIIVLFFGKQSIHKHQRDRWAWLCLLPQPLSVFLCPYSCWATRSPSRLPTTRWKRVFCSGNSVCRTRCWLSEGPWPFLQWPGASGRAVKVSLHPSGLGISLGSKKNRAAIMDTLQRHCFTASSTRTKAGDDIFKVPTHQIFTDLKSVLIFISILDSLHCF